MENECQRVHLLLYLLSWFETTFFLEHVKDIMFWKSYILHIADISFEDWGLIKSFKYLKTNVFALNKAKKTVPAVRPLILLSKCLTRQCTGNICSDDEFELK